MKKRYVILVLCICAVFAVIFGACNNTQNNSNSNSNKDYGTIEKIEVIIKGNNDSPNYYSCVYDDIPNNHEAFTLEDVTVNYVYTNGYRKEIGEDYYEVIKYNPDGQLSFNKVLFDFMEEGETTANVPGTYKLLFKTTDGLHSVDVVIDIIKSGVKEHEFNLKRYTDLEESDSEKVDVTAMTSINFAQQYNAEYKNYFFEASNYSINEYGISYVVTPYSENIVIDTITVTYKGKEYPKDQYFDQIQVGKVVNGNELLTMDDKLLPPGKYFVFAKFGETNPRFSVYSHPIPIEITTGTLIITKGKTIAEKQFLGDKTITEVIIGDSITSIGSGAFEDCTSLTRVTIPNSINSMENGVFKGCTSLTDITFPDSIKSIGNGVFEGCTSLTSITIPDSVTSIECGAFGGCSSLEEITIPFVGNNASAVGFGYIFGTNAFSGGKMTKQYYNYSSESYATYCIPTSLKKVTVNGDIIPFGSFYACDSLTSITVGNSIESIGDWAFYGCRNLVSVTIGSSVTSVSYEAVSGSYNLVEIYNLSSLNITAGSSSNGYLGRYALDVYTSLDSPSKLSTDSNGYIIYTDGEEKILVGYTGSETELTLPSSITAINKYAFYINSSITSVVIPDSVTSIGNQAFYNCYRLIEVYNLSSLNITAGSLSNGYVGYYAKNVYTSLETQSKLSTDSNGYMIYTDGDGKILVGCEGSEAELTLPSGITAINKYAFYRNSSITRVVIPDSVTSIGDYAFYGCTSLTSVTIGNSVESIGSSAFEDCTSLTSVTIGNSVESIGDYAFEYCTALTSVTIPNSVTSIGNYAFRNCNSLNYNVKDNVKYLGNEDNLYLVAMGIVDSTATTLTIADSCKFIGAYAFFDCDSLISVTISDSVESIGSHAFYNCTSLISVTISDSVESIGSYAFYNCASLSSVTIGNSVTSIGNSAFDDCYKLVEVYNLSSLTIEKGNSSNGYVGYYALDVYTSLETPSKLSTDSNGYIIYTDGEEKILIGYAGSETDLTLSSEINSIYKYAFYNNRTITSVVIPDSVTSIGGYAFRGCNSLTSLTIPNSVTSIGQQAFYNCPIEYASIPTIAISYISKSKLKEVIITSGASIGSSAFEDCTSLTSVTIGNSVTSIGDSAFYNCDSLTSVNYLGTIESWCGITFGDYYANPLYYANTLYLNGEEVTDLVIPDTVTEIKAYAFCNYDSLKSVTIGKSVEKIGNHAFSNCDSLTSITFEDPSTWYRTEISSQWENKTGGTLIDVNIPTSNDELFDVDYDEYWYKK